MLPVSGRSLRHVHSHGDFDLEFYSPPERLRFKVCTSNQTSLVSVCTGTLVRFLSTSYVSRVCARAYGALGRHHDSRAHTAGWFYAECSLVGDSLLTHLCH